MAFPFGEHLPRLARHHYQGHAVIHWQCTLEDRATGWLNDLFHSQFRQVLLHVAAREALVCPVYCLMPDHFHLVWMGLRRDTDQRNGMQFARQFLNQALAWSWTRSLESGVRRPPSTPDVSGAAEAATIHKGVEERRRDHQVECAKPWRLQKQAYDRILRPEERRRGAFQAICDYVRLNPVRAGFVARDEHWPFAGCVVPGYPDLHPARSESWEIFWRIYEARRTEESLMPPSEPPKLFDGKGDAWLR